MKNNQPPPPPKDPSKRKTKRLNYVPLIAVGCVFTVFSGVMVYTAIQRSAKSQQAAADADIRMPTPAKPPAFLDNHPIDPPPPPVNSAAPPPSIQALRPELRPAVATEDPRAVAWKAYYALVAQQQQMKAEAESRALAADSDSFGKGLQQQDIGKLPDDGSPGQLVPGARPAGAIAGTDPGAQAEKRAFLAGGGGGDTFGLNEELAAVEHGPKPNTVMEGTAIQGVMVGGVTTDMPGMMIGQISHNVCDAATGNVLLIPQNSRVIGKYDNSVSGGQQRIGVVWDRIIFPDTSSLQIGGMEGADQGGYAGNKDIVNTHWTEKFLSATLISIAGAAAQLSQPQQSAFSGYSPGSSATAALTQQYSQLGQEYARAGLAIPNTLELRPGYRFAIMVAKDMRLPPRGNCRNGIMNAAITRSSAIARGPVMQ